MSLVLPSGRYTGWKPSPVDPRNKITQIPEVAPPKEYDPRGETPAIVNQLELGGCTANATERAFRYAFIVAANFDPGAFSRLWIYAQERFREGGWKQFAEDSGAYGHDAFKVARHAGLILETVWPYDDYKETFNDREVFQHAKSTTTAQRHFIDSYSHPHPDLATFQAVLSSKKIISFGFTVYESFESDAVAKSGIVPLPQRGEQGGHEIDIEGYVTLKGTPYFLCANNWGTEWGDEGYCYFPLEYMFGYGTSDWRCVDSVKS